MGSLRTRVLAGVLLLSAAGLALLGVVTYAEQRSFLLGRVDQELRGAGPALSFALDQAGYRPAAARGQHTGGGSQGGIASPGGGPGAGPNLHLPPGTYGQRREASGKVLGHVLISYGQTAPPPRASRRTCRQASSSRSTRSPHPGRATAPTCFTTPRTPVSRSWRCPCVKSTTP